MDNIPESQMPDVREYLYIDADRIKNLLAQVYSGLPEGSEESHQRSRKMTAAISKIFSLGGEISSAHQSSEQRSLHDLHVTMLEENAEALGLLVDVSDAASRTKNWNRGKLHGKLSEGSLIRVESDVRVVDSSHFLQALKSFQRAAGDDDMEFMEMVESLTGALYGDQIAIRCYPCGVENPSCCFGGVVPGDSQYFKSERTTIFSRIGPDAQRWSALLQVARIPSRNPNHIRRDLSAFQGDLQQLTRTDNSINRHTFDSFILEIMREMEKAGIQEAPRFPEISVIPLALYRFVPRGGDLSELLDTEHD